MEVGAAVCEKNILPKLCRDEKGSSYLLILAFTFLILIFFIVGMEVSRVHDIREHIYDEMYRASNLAIKKAMYDSYRIDSSSKFDETIAKNSFEEYLLEDLNLTSSYEKLDEDGNEVYSLKIDDIKLDGDNARMEVKATVYAKPSFNLWSSNWEIPLNIKSRNIRTD